MDIITAIIIITSLFMVEKHYKWWLLYAGNSILFSIVTACKGLPGLTIMGLILCIIGIRNYILAKRKQKGYTIVEHITIDQFQRLKPMDTKDRPAYGNFGMREHCHTPMLENAKLGDEVFFMRISPGKFEDGIPEVDATIIQAVLVEEPSL